MSIINSKSNHKYPSPDPYIMCSSPLLSFLCGFFAGDAMNVLLGLFL